MSYTIWTTVNFEQDGMTHTMKIYPIFIDLDIQI